MDTVKVESINTCHVVAMPYPGRGHINPMMNLCKLLSSKKPDILFTFVVTEEWLGFIGSDTKPDNIRFDTIPNVIPSELGRAKDFPGFIEAVTTKMTAPFELVLDRLEPRVNAIIADSYLVWMTSVGNRTNIPVASFWPMSPTVFSIFHHFDLLLQNQHFPAELSERGEELVDYIPGVPSTRLADLPTMFHGTGRQVLGRALEAVSLVTKAQYFLFNSIYELEPQVIDVLKKKFPFPVYSVGPMIPYFKGEENSSVSTGNQNVPHYLEWLDSQPKGSVLYISMGSYLSVSSAQMGEIVAGVCNSGVRFLWVSRGETSPKDGCGDMGLIVPWCDQLKVLCHPAIGGFWTHCGWNSTIEGVFAGVPMLASPIFWDQVPDSKQIVEDWRIGWRVTRDAGGDQNLVTREEIANLVQSFMNVESNEAKEMRKRARKLQEICLAAIAKGGSTEANLDSFIRDIFTRTS